MHFPVPDVKKNDSQIHLFSLHFNEHITRFLTVTVHKAVVFAIVACPCSERLYWKPEKDFIFVNKKVSNNGDQKLELKQLERYLVYHC